MKKIVYGVAECQHYEGGGVVAVFSTKEKANVYADKRKLQLGKYWDVEVCEMEIDSVE